MLNTSAENSPFQEESSTASSAKVSSGSPIDQSAQKASSQSYTIFCSRSFRDSINSLVRDKSCTVGDLVRGVLLLLPSKMVEGITDPGEPTADDRETILVQSGSAKGRRLMRKPRLQLRLAPGYKAQTIRRALALALALHDGALALNLVEAEKKKEVGDTAPAELEALREESYRLKALVNALSFEPISDGVNSTMDALYVLGFRENERPPKQAIKQKFRMLAMIYHPDSPYAGDTRRMSQLNQAIALLTKA